MSLQADRNLTALLFNPFRLIAGASALLLGLGVIIAAGVVGSLSQAHFDGVFDVHPERAGPLWFFFSEGVVDWLVLAIVFALLGRIFSKTSFRFIDVFGTQALARWPMLLVAAVVLTPGFRRYLHNLMVRMLGHGMAIALHPGDHAVFSIVVVLVYLVVVWTVALMYRSYTISCNLSGGKAVTTFIVGVLFAEVLSKTVLHEIGSWAATMGPH